ncbi:hypothetical protein AF335_23385 [Streptomyces eurocidicus]|uniref:Uncharacterized protein n=1 Tax=Streptomyces eurocidicus TaxID=66423 RepID=A0A2N8NSN2_STREU|nr:hypothetical protein [Streptomyces eurocidicus]MBB5120043.1 hypothetical protein [Streptomyces eurocidicus]MBF6056481.1 hypothetical protein [Streptomyces eurocidicus]PNE31772.1 hypothetical protein AF335_23385 [Streptomyces eurocidicus]
MREVADAVGALGRAAALERAARDRSGWYARYLWVFAASQPALVPMALLWHGFTSAMVYAVANALLVTGLSVYAGRQRVVRRGFGLKHGLVVGAWALILGPAVVLGTTVFADSRPFAAAAALACALPLATGALLETRRRP